MSTSRLSNQCERCKRHAGKLTVVLCMGERGLRRYRICPQCVEAVQGERETRDQRNKAGRMLATDKGE